MSDITALLGAVAAVISALAAVGTFWVSARRGSDRESRRSATVAVEVTQDDSNVTPIDRGDARER